jgi:hypothetical protein
MRNKFLGKEEPSKPGTGYIKWLVENLVDLY